MTGIESSARNLRGRAAAAGLCALLTVCVVCTAAVPVVCAERVYLKHVDAALDSIELGDVPGSLEPLTDAVAEDANNPLARTVLGLALLCGGLENEALAEFSAVMEVDPGCGEALYGKALVHLAEGKTAQAQSVLAQAQSVLAQAQSVLAQARQAAPDLEIQEAIDYVEGLLSGDYKSNDAAAGPAVRGMAAQSLMNSRHYQEAGVIWRELQREMAGPTPGERPGCGMTFLNDRPLTAGGGRIGDAYRPPIIDSAKMPRVSGRLLLKADSETMAHADMVTFFVDGDVEAITNRPPFQYGWDTTKVSNGAHRITIEGCAVDGSVVSSKSMTVFVRNAVGSELKAARRSDESKQRWARMWRIMRLKPSVSAVNYGAAVCALNQGDTQSATAALERMMAADPSYRDGAHRLAAIYGQRTGPKSVSRISTDRRVVALTFDDGPREDTARLLEVLREHGVTATFFVVGKQVQAHPDMLKRIAAEGHEIENHTYSHRDLRRLTYEEIQKEIFKTAAAVRELTGRQMRFVRPPGGHEAHAFEQVMDKFGLTTALWLVNCSKFEGTTREKVASHVLSGVRPGGVVLMHNPEIVTLTALPGILKDLKALGYEFVTLSALADREF